MVLAKIANTLFKREKIFLKKTLPVIIYYSISTASPFLQNEKPTMHVTITPTSSGHGRGELPAQPENIILAQ